MWRRSQLRLFGRWFMRIEMAVALAATCLALALHVRLLLRAGPLWRDEINTVFLATRPTLAAVWHGLEGESFPLLTFVLLRAWPWLGHGSDLGVRVFGLVVGVFTITAVWWSSRRAGLPPPLLALSLFAVNPVVVRWGDSIRGYGLGQLAVVLTFTLVFEALRRPRPVLVVLAALAATASVQTVYQNSVLVFAIGMAGAVAWLARGDLRRAALALGIGAVAALSLLPYLTLMVRARDFRLIGVEGASLGHLASIFWRALGAEIRLGWPGQVQAIVWVVAVVVAMMSIANARSARRVSARARYALLVVLIAVPVHFAFLLAMGFPTMPWYSLSLVALLAVALEAMLPRGPVPFRVGRLVLATIVIGVVSPRAFWYVGRRQTNVDVAAAAVATGARREDFVVVSPWFLAVSFDRYYDGAAPWSAIPPLADTSAQRTDLLARQLQAQDPIGPLLARIESTLRAGHRVYWVGDPPPRVEGPPEQLPPVQGPVSGALQGAYCANWALHVAYELRQHAGPPRPVPLEPHLPPLPYERVRVWVTTPSGHAR